MKPKVIFGFATLLVALGALTVLHVGNGLALGPKYYDDTATGFTCDIDNCGSNQIRLIAGTTRYVQKSSNHVIAYFKSPTNAEITVSGGNFCPGATGDLNGVDNVAIEDYYGSHVLAAGTAVTKFVVGSQSKTGNGYRSGSPDCDKSIVFSVPASDLQTSPSLPGLYYVSIDVQDIDLGTPKFDGIINGFYITETNGDLYAIAQSGGSSGREVTAEELKSADNMTWKVRFGSDCTVSAAGDVRQLSYYDMDNDGGTGAQLNKQIKMELFDVDLNKTVMTWTPASDHNKTGLSPKFRFMPGKRYIWYIKDVYRNNTLQFSTPYDGIYYLNPCAGGGGSVPPPPQPLVRPYVKVDGGDVLAGASIGTGARPCAGGTPAEHNQSAGIVSWNDAAGNYRGAGSAYAARAWNYIQEFATGQGKAAAGAPASLSFSNSASSGAVDISAGLFGGMFAAAPCADYWDTRPVWNSIADFAGSSVSNLVGTRKYDKTANANNDLVIDQSSIPAGSRGTLYVEGNVAITGNITYDTSSAWSSRQQIPAFRLIVHGSIFIDPSVTRLDGLYVAIPDSNYARTKAQDPTSEQNFTDATVKPGTITTCSLGSADKFNSYDPAKFLTNSVASACGEPLLVNGSFVANQIWLLRAYGDVPGASAETFNYSVDTWLGADTNINLDTGTYQSIRGLPPVL